MGGSLTLCLDGQGGSIVDCHAGKVSVEKVDLGPGKCKRLPAGVYAIPLEGEKSLLSTPRDISPALAVVLKQKNATSEFAGMMQDVYNTPKSWDWTLNTEHLRNIVRAYRPLSIGHPGTLALAGPCSRGRVCRCGSVDMRR
eukprot:TRINITY_DN13927_c0_g1_i2.p1 TRINITY_DN13927_c0_g1~~TRINITY_DN13927_c0_g1_i2.p1  ORF type:complete len:141 (-),score=24.78 TRINITY_DN13927_c0_g1_i2:106-528(-)